MRRLKGAALLVAAAVLALGGLPAGAAELMKHSGTVLAVDRTAGTLVLGEIGPWRVERGETRITRLTISMVPVTEFTLAERATDGAAGFPGAFLELPLDPWYVKEGDFVTVTCLHEGQRLTALKVTVSKPDER